MIIWHEFLSSFFSFVCYPTVCLYVLSPVLSCPTRYPHKNNVRFVFTCSCCLIYLICVCLCIVVSNTYCVCFVSLHLVYPMLPVSLNCPFLIATSVFSNFYFHSLCRWLFDMNSIHYIDAYLTWVPFMLYVIFSCALVILCLFYIVTSYIHPTDLSFCHASAGELLVPEGIISLVVNVSVLT